MDEAADTQDWGAFETRPRFAVAHISQADLPVGSGVYVFYRDGQPVYVGKAASLRARLWTNHLRRGALMTNSAFRRNVAAFLGIASSADIKARRYQPSESDASRVWDWISECEIAWIECPTELDALLLESKLKTESRPPLTKR
jgi:excinuclease UvrABC nuclease subunit